METKIYEQCEHKWKTIEQYREFIGRVGNAIMGGEDHFKPVYVQKCEKCGKINKVS